jgi:hypothetical protein
VATKRQVAPELPCCLCRLVVNVKPSYHTLNQAVFELASLVGS